MIVTRSIDVFGGAVMRLTLNFSITCETNASPVAGSPFGTLTRAVLSENVDGAVVTIDAARSSDCSIEAIGAVKGTAPAVVGMAVRKRGGEGVTTLSLEQLVDEIAEQSPSA